MMYRLLVLAFGVSLLLSCGGEGATAPNAGPELRRGPHALVSIRVTPDSVSLAAFASRQFTATLIWADGNTRSTTVTWTATGGTVSSTGNYTAGGTAGIYRVMASAQGLADTSKAVITSSAPPPPPPSGSVIWNGDFETGTTSQYPVAFQCKAGRILVYSSTTIPAGAPAPPTGKNHAARMITDNTDTCMGDGKPRTQLAGKDVLTVGLEFWEQWLLLVPSNYPLIPRNTGGMFVLAGGDYGPPFDGQGTGMGPLGFIESHDPTRNYLGIGGVLAGQTAGGNAWFPITPGTWIYILEHKKMSNVDGGSGFYESWVNGQQVVWPNGATRLVGRTMKYGGTADAVHLSQYRGPLAIAGTSTNPSGSYSLYFGGAKIGTTRASVDTWAPTL